MGNTYDYYGILVKVRGPWPRGVDSAHKVTTPWARRLNRGARRWTSRASCGRCWPWRPSGASERRP
eukprot:8391520-Pyramimonas_sp.AAC.1